VVGDDVLEQTFGVGHHDTRVSLLEGIEYIGAQDGAAWIFAVAEGSFETGGIKSNVLWSEQLHQVLIDVTRAFGVVFQHQAGTFQTDEQGSQA